ncbi:MAG: (2Fe-2S)-binding protein [Steroidobacteraceae bacterium]
MYVCICHAVTDRDIREAVDQGARSLCDVQSCLPVGGCCGRCRDAAKDVVDEYLLAATRRSAA